MFPATQTPKKMEKQKSMSVYNSSLDSFSDVFNFSFRNKVILWELYSYIPCLFLNKLLISLLMQLV